MSYKDKVYNYFKFSSSVYTSINGKNKQSVQITGRINRKAFIFWLVFSLIFSFLAYAMNEKLFKNNMGLLIVIMILFIVTIAMVLIKSKLVFKNLEPKNTNINLYNRELPSNLRPAHVRILTNDGLVDQLSLASTIVDLVDRDYLEISKEENASKKTGLFKDENLKLIKTSKSDKDLLKYEKFIIDWFINQYGDGKEVSQEQVNKGLLNNVDSSSYKPFEIFEEWQALVIMSFPINKYFRKIYQDRSRITYAIFTFIGFTPLIPILGQFLSIYGMGCLLFASPMYVFNKNGVNEGGEWLNLKRFLTTFGDMKNKTAEMVKIWDFYLTYSIALDVSSIATKEIKDFFGDNIFRGTGNSMENKSNFNGEKVSDLSNYISRVKSEMIESNKQLELEIAEEMKKL
jgi:uncharacterized membrane protein